MAIVTWAVGILMAIVVATIGIYFAWLWIAQPDRRGARLNIDAYDAAAVTAAILAAVVVAGSFSAGYCIGRWW